MEDRNLLIEGLKKLSAAAIIKDSLLGCRQWHTRNREVMWQSSYAVSRLLLFEKQRRRGIAIQEDPMHLKFSEQCSHPWSKVVVYDTVGIE